MDDGLLVTWEGGRVPSDITTEQDLQWRVTSHYTNLSCMNFIFRNPDPQSFACARYTVDLHIAELKSCQVSDLNML